MKIAVMGAGGMGGFLGGVLARAGVDVTLIARGRNLEAIRSHGLQVQSSLFGTFDVNVPATDDPRKIGPVDTVLFCVKAYDLAAAAKLVAPLLSAQTAVVPVLNGIEVPNLLGEQLGEQHVLGGATYLACELEAPGLVRQRGTAKAITFGELTGKITPRVLAFQDTLQHSGLVGDVSETIWKALWEKFIVICSTGGVLALLRQPFGPVFSDKEASALFKGTMRETYAVAQASGAALAENTIDRLFMSTKEKVDPLGKSSTLQDLQAGRRLELEYLNGTTVRLGRELGVDTPFNQAIYAALKPYIEPQPRTRSPS